MDRCLRTMGQVEPEPEPNEPDEQVTDNEDPA